MMQRNKVKYNVIILAVILFQCLFIVYWGTQKEGFLGNELYSYELANDASGKQPEYM